VKLCALGRRSCPPTLWAALGVHAVHGLEMNVSDRQQRTKMLYCYGIEQA
jgi:hypothetical protein